MDQKNVEVVVDVSSFFLFEATGDSEADFELNVDVADADDEIDAQSCSCDLLDSCGTTFEPDNTGDVVHDHHFDDDIDVADGQEEEEEGEDREVIDQDWSGTTDGGEVEVSSTAKAAGQQKKKSRVCVDSTMEVMNEVDKNRLFWEACLAS